MKKETLDFVRKLTKEDKKTLSQKVTKVGEEFGELCKVSLPYEDAPGTTHRFIAKERILEEVADLFLTSISVAYDLGFTDEQIEEMIERKTIKWAELQSSEREAKFPVPFEIHVTVQDANREEFIKVCHALNVKPIVLDLQVGQEVLKDTMTSSKCYGHNSNAYTEMKRISNGLTRSGFDVVREKIETVPWHPGAPSEKQTEPTMPKDCYFETHIGVVVPNEIREEALHKVASSFGAHVSKNAFKSFDDGGRIIMVTHRVYSGVYENFKAETATLRDMIKESGFQIENSVVEFSIYDTKVKHDSKWIEGIKGNAA